MDQSVENGQSVIATDDHKLSEQANLKEKVRTKLKDESINHITMEFEGQDGNFDLEDC